MEIDALAYVYKANSNELLKVTDNLETSPSGFNDRANNAEEYGYDLHGNMTRDDNKGITDIRYNHLNLPIKITFGTQGEIAYVYNAEGKKLEKTVTQTGSTAVTTKYLDGFQYVDNVLQFFPHAEGYVKKNGNNYNYVFNYTDHLGNVRLSYSDLDKDGVLEQDERILTVATDGSGNATEFFVSCIIEENNYYPFGLKHSGYNEGGFEASKYKVKYNGMEYQDELGLNFYDYGARNYDAALGKWMNIDPLAEVSRRWSPYAYTYNNPVRFTDPDGMLAMDQVGLSDRERDILGMNNRSRGDGDTDEGDGKVVSSNEMGSWIRHKVGNESKVIYDFDGNFQTLAEVVLMPVYSYEFVAKSYDFDFKISDGLTTVGGLFFGALKDRSDWNAKIVYNYGTRTVNALELTAQNAARMKSISKFAGALGNTLGTASIVMNIAEDYSKDNLGAGTIAKTAIGVTSLLFPGFGLVYGFVDVMTLATTGTSLTNHIGNAVDNTFK